MLFEKWIFVSKVKRPAGSLRESPQRLSGVQVNDRIFLLDFKSNYCDLATCGFSCEENAEFHWLLV